MPAAWAELVDLVLARACGGCAAAGTRWCEACAGALATQPQVQVLREGLPVWSAAVYDDPVRSAVLAWKDRGRADLTGPLAVGLRRAAQHALAGGAPSGLVVVPVPSSRRSRRARGHEPVRDLAAALATGLRRRGTAARVVPALRQSRRVHDQAGLGALERAANLAGALALAPGWAGRMAGRPVLVVDDVVTTGATLVEARRVLERAGARVVGAATVAATQRGPLRRSGGC